MLVISDNVGGRNIPKPAALAIVIIIVVIVAAAAYMGTQPAASPTAAPTTAAPTTVTATATATTTAPPTATHEITPTATTPPQLKMAAIHWTPSVFATTWDILQHEPMLRMEEKYDLVFDFSESVGIPDAERVARSYADKGYDIIFFTSWFPDAIRAVAGDYPEVVCIGAGGGVELHILYPPPEEIPPNVGHYDAFIHEASFLNGYLAGKMTETNVVGIVGTIPVINNNQRNNAFIEGVKTANPDADVKLAYIYSFFDPVSAKEAAFAMIDQGADILYSGATGVEEAASERGVYLCAAQLARLFQAGAQEIVISSDYWILDPILDEIVSSVIEDKFESKEYFKNMADGGADFLIHLPDDIPADIISELDDFKERIIQGVYVVVPNSAPPEEFWGL